MWGVELQERGHEGLDTQQDRGGSFSECWAGGDGNGYLGENHPTSQSPEPIGTLESLA